MVDMRKYVGETYLKVDDVRDRSRRVTIVRIKIGNYDKPEMTLDDNSILSLNVTNTRTLTKAYGPNSDDWAGRQIELKLGTAPYQGQQIPSIVVVPLSPSLNADEMRAAQTRAAASDRGDMDDSIPF